MAAEVIVNTSCCSIDEEVVEILSRTCRCTRRIGSPCSRELTSEDVSEYCLAITELSSSEFDIAILEQLHVGVNVGELLTNSRGVCRPDTRQRVTFQYAFKGKPICREMFLFLHKISRTRLYNLTKHLRLMV